MNYQIIAKQVKRMNRPPTFECNQDTNYSYKSCVKESLAVRVGCQSPWDGSEQLEGVRRCSTTEEVVEYERIYHNLYMGDQQDLMELTGCLLPCTYTQYSLVGSPKRFSEGYTYFTLSYVSTDIVVREEMLLFPLDSLVSELGGALGLFLGFSFFGLLSSLQTLAKRFYRSINL